MNEVMTIIAKSPDTEPLDNRVERCCAPPVRAAVAYLPKSYVA
jgi:hypothetical protein